MTTLKVCLVLMCVGVAFGSPAALNSWKDLLADGNLEEMRSLCAEDDPIACLKYKAFTFLESFLKKDNFQISDNVEVRRNSVNDVVVGRSSDSVEDKIEKYVKTHDVTFKLPIIGSVTLGGRNLESEELDFKLNFSDNENDVQARKSKLKKIFIPILVFVLLKAMTLVPLALGILGLKAWNALQLSFFSFVISVGLAIFQLCKKIAADSAHPQIAAHGPWESAAFTAQQYAARSFDENALAKEAQTMAYSGYLQD